MTKVGKSDCEGTFTGTNGNDEDAPIPAVRQYREICRVRTPKLSFKFSSAMA
jgi:hypothetical protein